MVIPASDIVTVDAGGQLFKTTVSTLVSSGAKFFHALFGQTGLALSNSASMLTPKQDAKSDDNNAQDALPSAIFVDSDPDIFADVLYFMRRNCISPKTASDPLRLKMLQTEADFFIYDALSDECAKQLEDIAVYSASVIVSQGDEQVIQVIQVPRGQVLFIVSATLAGECRVIRYVGYPEGELSLGKNVPGCYLATYKKDHNGDFQLFYTTKSKNTSNDDRCCIAHVGMDQVHCGKIPMNLDFRQEIRTCISGDVQDVVTLSVTGAGQWHVHYWVGPAGRIPQLGETVTQK